MQYTLNTINSKKIKKYNNKIVDVYPQSLVLFGSL
jgi:hypothetical protein